MQLIAWEWLNIIHNPKIKPKGPDQKTSGWPANMMIKYWLSGLNKIDNKSASITHGRIELTNDNA